MFLVLGRAYPSTLQGQRTKSKMRSCGIITKSPSAPNLFFYKQWYDADVKNILNKEGKFLKLLIFYPSLNAATDFLCFIGLCNTIPKHWRKVFRRDNKNHLVVSDETVHPFKNSRPICLQSRAFYVSKSLQKPWSEVRLVEAGFTDQTIRALYVLPFKLTKKHKAFYVSV